MRIRMWKEFVENKDRFIGGDAEMIGFMLNGSVLRGRISDIRTEDGQCIISFDWIAELRGKDGWILSNGKEPVMNAMDDSILPPHGDEDGTVYWGFSEAIIRLYPKGYRTNLDPTRIKEHPAFTQHAVAVV